MKRSGMTLLEILIVLSIMAVLIAIIAPRIIGAQKKGYIKTTQVQIAAIKDALEQFYVDNSNFPQTEEGIAALFEKPTDEKRYKQWDGPYFDSEKLPVDPWGNEYKYEYPPTHGKRDFPNISSFGPDKEENTDDDVVNWEASQDRTNSSDSDSSTSSSLNNPDPRNK